MSGDYILSLVCCEVYAAYQGPGLDISRSALILMDHVVAAGQGMQKVQEHRNSHVSWLQGI